MLKPNKYLREIGIDENFWLFKDAKSGDERFFPDEDGFIDIASNLVTYDDKYTSEMTMASDD